MQSESTSGVSLPFSDDILRVSPRFEEWGDVGQVAGLALFALVPLALVLWLYRYELRLVSRAAAVTLLSLRVIVILLLWFIICWQPILTSTTSREVPTRVVVAVDISGSMGVTDPRRPPGDKLRLARALRLPVRGDEPPAKRLNDWIVQYANKGDKATPDDIQWVAGGEAKDAAERRRLAQQRRAQHDRVCDEVDKLTRTEIVLRLLTTDGGRLLKDLSAKHQVELLGFRQKVAELKPEQLDKILKLLEAIKPAKKEDVWELRPEQSAALFALNTAQLDQLLHKVRQLKAGHKEANWSLPSTQLDGLLQEVAGKARPAVEKNKQGSAQTKTHEDLAVTDLAPPLERSLKPGGQGEGRLIGVVLLSDGGHNAASSPARPAEKLGKRRTPILPVLVGTPFSRPSVTLTEVQAPASASSKNVNVTVRVRFKVTGMRKQDIVVTLERADQREGQPAGPEPVTVAHDGTDRYYDATFVVGMDPDGKPLQTFLVKIKPEEKPRTGNLMQQVVVKLDDTKPKVLLVDGEARWEYHYLANALLRDPGVRLRRVLFEPPLRTPDISDEQLKAIGNPERKLPEGPDALADYQCIVLGDVGPDHLPLADRRRLEQFVAKHGGTLVLVAGKRFTPLAYAHPLPADADDGNNRDKDDSDPLLKLLPIESPRAVSPTKGFPVTLTGDGKRTPFMQTEADAQESEERWAAFPRHYWGVIGKAKPAATVLAYYRDPDERKGQAVKDEEEERKISRAQSFIVRHNYGRGQVLFVGLDSTWRWRYRIGDTYHHRFWGQVIRWAASDYIRFGTDKPIYAEGEDVTIDLSLEDRETRSLPKEGDIKTKVIRLGEGGIKDRTVALVPLSAPESLRVLKGKVRDLPVGRYKIELDKPDPSLKVSEQSAALFQVMPRENREMDHVEANPDLLRDLAQKSGDKEKVYTAADASDVVDELTRRPFAIVERSERGLWQEWGTLVVFLVLMTAEWVGRKWAGLP
jgi:hypothetical protein